MSGSCHRMTVPVWLELVVALLFTTATIIITADPEEKSPSPFLPALPGETPACAKKGKSFCEYVEGYPE